MTQKARGGRGQRAADPYQRLSVTVPPRLREWVDKEAQRQGVTRSEVVAQALTQAEQAARAATATAASQPTSRPILKQAGKGKKRAEAMEKLRQIGERLPGTETFLKQRPGDSRDDH